jgi:hypothetical protein
MISLTKWWRACQKMGPGSWGTKLSYWCQWPYDNLDEITHPGDDNCEHDNHWNQDLELLSCHTYDNGHMIILT